MGRIIFITGTDTGAGKTVAAGLLLHHLRGSGVKALAMKPFCTGDRDDVEVLQSLQAGELSDEEMNPWFFKVPLAPLLAARQEGRRVELDEVLARIVSVSRKCDFLLVEGAGGLLSPLGEGVTLARVIGELGGDVLVVGPNKLGVVNSVCLTLGVLSGIEAGKRGNGEAKKKLVLLMGQERADVSASSNAELIEEMIGDAKKRDQRMGKTVFELPLLDLKTLNGKDLEIVYKKVKKVLQALVVELT